MIKVAGKHKSIPREIKISLKKVLDADTKIVMQDICFCRHSYSVGTIKIVKEYGISLKLRGYFGSGVINLFLKFKSVDHKNITVEKTNRLFNYE